MRSLLISAGCIAMGLVIGACPGTGPSKDGGSGLPGDAARIDPGSGDDLSGGGDDVSGGNDLSGGGNDLGDQRDVGSADVAFFDTQLADVRPPDIRLPDIQLPDIQLPDIQLPDIQLPDIQLPDIQLPDIQLPDIQLPDLPPTDCTGRNVCYVDPIDGTIITEDQAWDPLTILFHCDLHDIDGVHWITYKLFKNGVLHVDENRYAVKANTPPANLATDFSYTFRFPLNAGSYEWECGGRDGQGNDIVPEGRAAVTVLPPVNRGDRNPDLLYPDDFEYLGSFEPHEGGPAPSGADIAFYPDGDQGPADPDGFPGSLFVLSGRNTDLVGEISIPAPSTDFTALPVATRLQTMGILTMSSSGEDYMVTQAWGIGAGDTTSDYGGLEWVPATGSQTSDKLYFSLYRKYPGGSDKGSIGFAERDIANPNAQGLFHLHNIGVNTCNLPWHYNMYSGYLFKIPQDFADQHLGGYSIAAGRNRIAGAACSHKGPSIFAFKPMQSDTVAAQLEYDQAVDLVHYLNGGYPYWKLTDWWHTGEWVSSASGKRAIAIGGDKGLGACEYINPSLPDKYAERGFDYCSGWGKGNKCTDAVGEVVFFDPADLAAVASGDMDHDEPVPYAVWNMRDAFWPDKVSDTCKGGGVVKGLAFDEVNRYLYVMAGEVHIFRVH